MGVRRRPLRFAGAPDTCARAAPHCPAGHLSPYTGRTCVAVATLRFRPGRSRSGKTGGRRLARTSFVLRPFGRPSGVLSAAPPSLTAREPDGPARGSRGIEGPTVSLERLASARPPHYRTAQRRASRPPTLLPACPRRKRRTRTLRDKAPATHLPPNHRHERRSREQCRCEDRGGGEGCGPMSGGMGVERPGGFRSQNGKSEHSRGRLQPKLNCQFSVEGRHLLLASGLLLLQCAQLVM